MSESGRPRIRILELVKGLDIGGAEKLLIERLRVRDTDTFDYRVAYLDANAHSLKPEFEAIGVPTFCLGAHGRFSPGWLPKLRRYLIDQDIDVVHTHSPLMASGTRAVLRSMGRRRPVSVTTEHNTDYHPGTRLVDAATIRLEDAVVAVSEPVAQSVVCRRYRKPVLIHHGVNLRHLQGLAETASDTRSSLPVPRERRLVVSVANFRAEKNHSVLVLAAKKVIARKPDVIFVLVGHGPLESSVRRRIQSLQMAESVFVLGAVPDAAAITACADVFVLGSLREGRPVALMEALALGVPCVVTSVGDMASMVRHDPRSRIVSPGQAGQLADAIVAVLDSKESYETSIRQLPGELDIERATRQIEMLYRDLCLARGRGDGR